MEKLLFYYNLEHKGANKGVNFSPEYRFFVDYENRDGQNVYTLRRDMRWEPEKHPDIFRPNNISDKPVGIGDITGVTAIVGENGAGKTTLMRGLLNACHRLARGAKASLRRDYVGFYAVIGFSDNGAWKWKAYANFRNPEDNPGLYQCGKDDSIPELCVRPENPTGNFSAVYLTNSYYENWDNWDPILNQAHADMALLTPNRVEMLAERFFNSRLRSPETEKSVDLNSHFLQYAKRHNLFQGICDLQYYISRRRMGGMMEYRPVKFNVRFASAWEILRETGHIQEGDKKLEVIVYEAECAKRRKHFSEAEDSPINRMRDILYTNLVFERSCAEGLSDWAEAEKSLPSGGEVPNRWFMSGVNPSWRDEENYYKSALAAIEDLEKFSASAVDSGPNGDFLSFREEEYSGYMAFLQFVEKCWHMRPFIMKYLIVEQPGMSSGERALQNFLSWLNLLTDYKDLLGDRSIRLRRNLILMIDEMDLYLHPEWQRRFLSKLMEELKRFPNGFRVQIIFATHSPLCLSDMPKENVVYLSRRDTTSDADGVPPFQTDDPKKHAQTFGAPVFTLLDDAFFLKEKGTMGEFAEAYINGVLGKIYSLRENCRKGREKPEDLESEIQALRDAARPIGNEILRKHIAHMLDWVREDWTRLGGRDANDSL